MSDNDGNDVSKLIILTLGLATIGFFAYLIFKESRGCGYRMGGLQSTTASLADDSLFNLERKIHNLEMARSLEAPRIMKQVTGDYPESRNDNSGAVTRKVVSMGNNKQQNVNVPNAPNIQGLSRGDQDRVRRMFFDML